MKIKLSKSDWELIGKKTGWIKKAQMLGDFDTMSLGPTPSEEPCAQTGKHDPSINKMEVRAFINQLKRLYPNESPNAYFIMERNEHEFGTYYEAAIKYNIDDEEASEFAYNVEHNTPEFWDEAAKIELEQKGYFSALAEPKEEPIQPIQSTENKEIL